jgi:hypothetical protein
MRSDIRLMLAMLVMGAMLIVMAGCGSSTAPAADAPVAGNRFAVIISGGYRPSWNASRFWNNCAYFYTTLKQNGVPDENIYVIFGDGLDPSNDSSVLSGDPDWYEWLRSSPFDLDGDSRPDIRFQATKSDVTAVFNLLANRVGPDDILYLFATSHGGPTADNAYPYPVPNAEIALWGSTTMTADELAAKVDKVKAGAMVGIFTQCFSGGFVERLAAPNRVLMSASRWWESSHPNSTLDYDEFSYHATRALADPSRGDASGDGLTSMEEAYLYALAHGAWEDEHPSYHSNPSDLGRRLSLRGRIGTPSPPVVAGFVEQETTEPYPILGQPQGWHGDDGVWAYRLPFGFPFGAATYDSITISSDGIIYFANPSAGGDGGRLGLAGAVAAAPLWGNLTTAAADTDIYLDARGDQVTIAWVARTTADDRHVNVAARLQRSGVITFYYGPGNDLTGDVAGRDKTIGVSLGGGQAHYSLRNGASALANARPVSFVPVSPGQ